jgi:hypothetical protein
MPEPAEVDMIRCGDELPLTAAHGRWRRSRFRHSRHRRHVVHVAAMPWARRVRPRLQGAARS